MLLASYLDIHMVMNYFSQDNISSILIYLFFVANSNSKKHFLLKSSYNATSNLDI